MVEDQKKGEETSELSEEEKQSEESALAETPDEEIRSGVIKHYGLDEDADKDLIDKIVNDTKEGRKELSTAIRQKIKKREELIELQKTHKKPKKEETKKEEDEEKTDDEKFDDKIGQKVSEKLEKNVLNSLDVSDDLKKEIESYAKINKCSIKQAFDSDYIKFKKEAEDKKKKAEDASIDGKRRTKPGKLDLSDMKPEDFDLSTEQGRKDFDEYKKWLKTQ